MCLTRPAFRFFVPCRVYQSRSCQSVQCPRRTRITVRRKARQNGGRLTARGEMGFLPASQRAQASAPAAETRKVTLSSSAGVRFPFSPPFFGIPWILSQLPPAPTGCP